MIAAIVSVIIIRRRLKSTANKNLVVPQVEPESRGTNSAEEEDIESLIDDNRNSNKRNSGDATDTGEMKYGS